MNLRTDPLQTRMADELEAELATIGTRRAMAAVDRIEELDRAPVHRPAITDPIERQTIAHRTAIERHEQEILALRRGRDLAIRTLEGDLAEAERAFTAAAARIRREIDEANGIADRRIAVRRTLVASSQAALDALAPPARQPEAERVLPRHVHSDISLRSGAGIMP